MKRLSIIFLLLSIGLYSIAQNIPVPLTQVKLYDFLDESKMFQGTVEKEVRSLMNVPFVTESKELDAEVVKATKAAGFGLKHLNSGSFCNIMLSNDIPVQGIRKI